MEEGKRWVNSLWELRTLVGKKVNIWTPGTREFKAIKPGELFLFKVHNKKSTGEKGEIVGGGYFAYYEQLSIPDAWEKYGRGNGRESLQKMQEVVLCQDLAQNKMRSSDN